MQEILNKFKTIQSEKEKICKKLDELYDSIKEKLSDSYFYYPQKDVFCKFEPSSQNILACGELNYKYYVPSLYGGWRCDRPCFAVFSTTFKLTEIPNDLIFIDKDEFNRQINLRLEKLKEEGYE